MAAASYPEDCPATQRLAMNLLLVSVDSLRLDSVSRTGDFVQTPRFDSLTRAFHFSDRLFSVSSATRPVHSSLFTGLYPFEHGILGQSDGSFRAGVPHLFELFRQRGYLTRGFSEANTIFEGLPFAGWIEPLRSESAALARLCAKESEPQFLFLHFWGTHVPYGAADGRAFGETEQLLKSGAVEIVRDRYWRAIERLFEGILAPMLESIDVNRWCVVILGDHGESWTPEEPYHGITLRNSVLRVPLFVHIPGSAMLRLSRPIFSIIDLFPFFANLFQLDMEYAGYGIDIRRDCPQLSRRLAEIRPLQGRFDDVRTEPLTSTKPLVSTGSSWTLFDEERKFTYWVNENVGLLESTLAEEKLSGGESMTEGYKKAYASLRAGSRFAGQPLKEVSSEDERLLEDRLRALGYL